MTTTILLLAMLLVISYNDEVLALVQEGYLLVDTEFLKPLY
ncbi:MAG: hypothetical protein WBM91_11065 [Eudoraea sp.]|jgi:hypothetical protein